MKMLSSRQVFVAMLLVFCVVRAAGAVQPPAVELADTYPGELDLSKYWVSEKYDGVRGYWTGKRLLTRGGTVIHAPSWFTKGWPDQPMDGELWLDYGEFATASGIVRRDHASDAAWHKISYRVFDLPDHGGDFNARVPAIRQVVSGIDQPWVVAIRQFHVKTSDQLQAALKRVREHGGEGLILHRGDAPYRSGRRVGLYKLKPYQDAEARVVAMNPGHGRLKGMMGSLEVVTPGGRRFAIGSGFTDEQRADPPPVGSWITYRFTGRTSTGLPRFARFLHRRPGGEPPEVETERADTN